MNAVSSRFVWLVLIALVGLVASAAEGRKKIVLIAGRGSHGFGSHAYKAGFLLLAKALNEGMPAVQAVVHHGWPKDPAALDDADAIFIGCDGGAGTLVNPHIQQVEKLVKRGVGMGCIHYAVLAPKGQQGDRMLRWIGGYYETFWSVNPTWEAHFKKLPDQPIARGVEPFKIHDEWYYHMRFVEGMNGVTPILSAIPPDSTRQRPDGAHSGNPHVRARMGMPEHVAWAYDRPGGGRGFGFTGMHFHWNWGHDGFRKIVLNALVWIAGAEVPPKGVPSKTPSAEELAANQEGAKPKNWRPEPIQKMIDNWNRPPPR